MIGNFSGKPEMDDDKEVPAQLTHRILGCAIEVHRALGPGLLENAYKACLVHALRQQGLEAATEVPIPLRFQGMELDASYRADVVVEGKVLLELKVVDALQPVHAMQVLTYLRFAELPLGLLINFNVPILMNGVKRLICSPRRPRPQSSAPSQPGTAQSHHLCVSVPSADSAHGP